jgi:parvulin-like peptidyl-prolyl isomerase
MKMKKSSSPARWLGLGLALAVALALGAACGKKDAAEARPAAPEPRSGEEAAARPDPVILRVGSAEYHNADFAAYLKRIMGSSPDSLTDESMSRLYDRFVEDKLLIEAAGRQGITLTDEEKGRYQQKLREEFDADKVKPPAPEDLAGLSEKLLIEKYTYALVKDIAVSDGEVQAYYAAHKSDFLRPERVKVSQILLRTEEKAIDVLARVKSQPEEVFRSVARQESTGAETSASGQMGVFGPGQLPYEIEKVILSLKEGEISQIVQSSYGFHIFRLDKRFPPELVSLDQAAPGIRTKLLDAKIAEAVAANLEDLKRTIDWTASPENLSFAYQRNAS